MAALLQTPYTTGQPFSAGLHKEWNVHLSGEAAQDSKNSDAQLLSACLQACSIAPTSQSLPASCTAPHSQDRHWSILNCCQSRTRLMGPQRCSK